MRLEWAAVFLHRRDPGVNPLVQHDQTIMSTKKDILRTTSVTEIVKYYHSSIIS